MKNLAIVLLFVLTTGACIASGVNAVDSMIAQQEKQHCSDVQAAYIDGYLSEDHDDGNALLDGRITRAYDRMRALCKS